MADGFITVAPDSTGKSLQTFENTVGGNDVHAEAVVLVDNTGNYLSTLPVSLSANLNVGNINVGNVGIVGPVTVEQSNAANFNATVTGTFWQATQPVSGPLTDTELRATAVAVDASGATVPVSGTFWQATQPVSGPITNTELRASPVSVTGVNINTSNVAVKMFTGAPNLASGQVTATNVAATLVSARALRRSVSIRNLDATNTGYIGPAPIGITNGMLMLPRESISVDFVGIISVITASGTANFAYLETYD